jgi:hypothetical protein
VYGTVRTVVWEDGGANNPASYPIGVEEDQEINRSGSAQIQVGFGLSRFCETAAIAALQPGEITTFVVPRLVFDITGLSPPSQIQPVFARSPNSPVIPNTFAIHSRSGDFSGLKILQKS